MTELLRSSSGQRQCCGRDGGGRAATGGHRWSVADRPLEVFGARVELLRTTALTHYQREEPLEEDRHAATVPVADHVDLEWDSRSGSPLPSGLRCHCPAPSVSTPDFTVPWLLRAVLDRPLRFDPATRVGLSGTTA